MSVMTELDSRPEEVGKILVKVQDELRELRDHLLSKSDGQIISVADLENALARTEQGLQRKTEEVVHQINNSVMMLPLSDPKYGGELSSLETTIDLRRQPKATYYGKDKGGPGQLQLLPPRPNFLMKQPIQTQGLTPSQQLKQQCNLRAMANPYNAQNRNVLNDNYGIQLPLIPQKPEPRQIPLKPLTGSTVEHLTILPKANRVDAQLAPPPITEDDASKGIRSLIERGLIPPAAHLTLEPSPIRRQPALLHNPADKSKAPTISEMMPGLALVHLDVSNPVTENEPKSAVTSFPSAPTPRPTPQPASRTRESSASGRNKTPATVRTFEMPLQPLESEEPPPTTPASGDLKTLSHRFAIQNGHVKETQPEFLAFKQHYCLTWGSIVTTLKHLERMLTRFSVPIAFVNGDKLADLSMEFELERPPSIEHLLCVIVNRDDVEAMVTKPGRKFLGMNGQDLAATTIQSTWRMYCDRIAYLEYRKHKWAAGVIAISWIMHIKMVKVRHQLVRSRADQLENFKFRAKKFAASWDRIKTSKRVVIHIPSLGLAQKIRDSINDFGIQQNTQMARLCDIRDPNVDVIFVSPVPLSDETLQYYSKLLGLKAAVESGKVDDQCNMEDRFKIIVPEAIKSFPTHRMCLATLLKYSPQTMRRIKLMIRGRDAYIVTTVPHKDDLAVADYLEVPILAPEPEIARLYSTKSGCKRVFASAGVGMPPGEYDIYSLGQLHECLAQLVTENLGVQRWLFKLDEEFDGRGIAYCNITDHLKCYKWALKESQRYGEKWSKKWAQESAYIKIHAEIGDVLQYFAEPVNKNVFPTWEKFLAAFLGQGGVVEACPPAESITTLTVDMLIEPSGRINMVTCGDQIHAESQFSCWGISFPQSSVDPEVLNKVCLKIGDACKARGIVGYFTIDFVTFISGTAMDQRLWAVDLSLHYSDSLGLFQLVSYVTGGLLNTRSHVFEVEPPKEPKKPRRRRLAGTDELHDNNSRFAVMSTRLLHTNLAVVHYSVFFQMCRAHGIGYDIKEKQGSVFTLLDSFNRERLGMVTIGDTLQGGLATFARNLSVIHQEISAPNMQGVTNFKGAIGDIEGILGTTIQNAEEMLAAMRNEEES
ncbi:IQ domain-containing protein H-like isoform X2 [Gigantopelta aegis]|uniref:IQ domain-containing protein H-like isoform X2 n=1 Tax=Gigantopelta aegis TaxID=1735272 RepID=UPI001B88DE77|nr:IQ domain-containing protein H-like isoform X2 [Gigantopelta aegis]